jgi:hypothetical protein
MCTTSNQFSHTYLVLAVPVRFFRLEGFGN